MEVKMMGSSSSRVCFKVLLVPLLAACLIFLNVSCASRHAVVASTGTMIGVEISENPANATVQAKLGYNRAEIAVVPTNRSADKEAGNTRTGATDVPDVLMELKYSGIFSTGENSGIYQRLAVGSNAVKEPGAAFMFAKGLDPGTALQVQKALSGIPESSPDVRVALSPLGTAYVQMFEEQKNVFDKAATDEGFVDFSRFLSSDPSASQVSNVKGRLLKNEDIKKKIEAIESKK
jgi:hypothetical protein